MKYIALFTENHRVGDGFLVAQSAEFIEAEDDEQALARAGEKVQGAYSSTSRRHLTELYAIHHEVR